MGERLSQLLVWWSGHFRLGFHCLHLQVLKASSSGIWVVGGLRSGGGGSAL